MKKRTIPWIALAALLAALCGCANQPEPVVTPAPSEAAPQEHTPDGTAELERLPLPKGYAPLTAPAAAGPSEKDVRQYAYEDLADPQRPAIDLSGIPDRLWPGGGYESSEQTDGKTFTFTGDDGRQELLYWDDRYAMYVRNDTAMQT